ncbi:uncharacterized protein K452DRAFT_323701 [Aplosporella prunicola CBS 121167]|uniref:Actin cytoskeleton-regulatory complex protein SLA1 n=1 Tax=Aplosporella prunicola CBS 121167 TaxID=1176127 RepID=A0A6A6BT48_9PEZI|nr:uncharacterized protein K452DRAFT_323701 [Aplosporella prunicola CBS 121167]KAF2146553.1 hypothetical protein K452DRAFT_323701 [Aplosporella prunicola CBS 121167]
MDTSSEPAHAVLLPAPKDPVAVEQEDKANGVERQLRLKVDLRLCTIAGILCSLNLLDSGVISSASVTSMLSDLDLDKGNRYSVSIFIFTIASIAFQLPSTIAVRTVGPRRWLSFITLCFGVITLCTGFIHTWKQMIALRVLLGAAMSGIYPALTYLISTYFTRKEQQLRFAFLQSGEVIVLATGGIVNFGLGQLHGKGGLEGWRWMFIVQGLISTALGIAAYWWMVDFPEDAYRSFHFFTEEESEVAARRIQKDRGDVHAEPFSVSKVLVHAHDPKVYGFCCMYFLLNLVSTSLSYFLPVILQDGMGFSSNQAILLSAPPYYYAVVPALLSSWFGDTFRLRDPVIIFNSLCLIIGFVMLGFSNQVTVRYVGTYIATGAYVANWAALAAYQANNIVGQWKRVFTAAVVAAFNGAGGIAGSFIVRNDEAPRYMTAIWTLDTATRPRIRRTPSRTPGRTRLAAMVFLGIYKALYDYTPQGANELEIKDGDLLFVLEKSTEDDWWKARKKADNDSEDEPEGLIPNNYVEEASPIAQAKALYDYTRQTDEELSFTEDAIIDVYDTSDPDWTLVGLKGDFGFAPANYIELTGEVEAAAEEPPPPPPMPMRPQIPEPEPEPEPELEEEEPPAPAPPSANESAAAALAAALQQKSASAAPPQPQRTVVSPPPAVSMPPRQPQYTPEESDEDMPAPSLPRRPISQVSFSDIAPAASSPPAHRVSFASAPSESEPKPQVHHGYHLYNIHEMISHMGKSKKMPMTLGINIPKGMIMIAPERSKDGPQREWTADKLTHYSIEGKHVFMDLVRPSKNIDFHAGAKDTAQQIVAALGELAGAARGEGLREVFAAASGNSHVQKKGKILYEFMAQGDDEVTVAVDDEVLILDDTRSEEWWMVRRIKNGREGVVPSSYVEVTDIITKASSSSSDLSRARSTVEQNRLEEQRLAREALKKDKEKEKAAAEVGPGLALPARTTSLRYGDKPDPVKTRTWTDRSGSFKVEAEFIGLRDGKIHLHKLNGVKIAVPVPKMSIEDLEYVEKVTGVSLDEDKPLSDIKKRNSQRSSQRQAPRAGITVETYDWFDFFLQCGVNPQVCERYASSFTRDNMGEENLPDISEKVLRTLGLKEGDILRVMKFLDNKYGRAGTPEPESGLFSGPGGTLKNNTRKGRPAPAVQTNDVVDPEALKQKTDEVKKDSTGSPQDASKSANGFDDNAWEVKPSKQPEPTATTAASEPSKEAAAAPPTGAMAELSMLSPPLQPTPAPQPAPAAAPAPAPAQQPQPTGASPGLFDQLANQPPGQAPPRARPQAPMPTGQAPNSLIAPPPQRSSSAPQNASQFAPPAVPLHPQMTGFVAPPGHSMNDINQQRMMQQYGQQPMQAQPTGFMPQPTGFNQFGQQPMMSQPTGMQFPQPTGFMPQPTGFNPQLQNQFMMGNQAGSPFADPTPRPQSMMPPMMPQATGMQQRPQSAFGTQPFQPQPLQPQATGVNAFLPPALQPQKTSFSMQPQQTGFQPPPIPPIPQQQTAAPLQAQKTGPAPNIKFGVNNASKLTAQPTGKRANLSQATPQNPFGF